MRWSEIKQNKMMIVFLIYKVVRFMNDTGLGASYYPDVKMISGLRIYIFYVLDKKYIVKILLERPEILPLTCHGHWMSLSPITWR